MARESERVAPSAGDSQYRRGEEQGRMVDDQGDIWRSISQDMSQDRDTKTTPGRGDQNDFNND